MSYPYEDDEFYKFETELMEQNFDSFDEEEIYEYNQYITDEDMQNFMDSVECILEGKCYVLSF